ncbi:MAG: lipase family protein [archaeon]|nr:lipase family protein [archaeon]
MNGDGVPITIDYDGGIHHLMYAYAAYCSPTYLENWSCKWCGPNGANLTVTSFVNSSKYNLFGYVGYDVGQKAIFVVFRGTEESSLKNWIMNLQSSKHPIDDPALPGAKVESGFLRGWSSLKDATIHAFKQLLADPRFSDYSVVCSGHSLGGALAVGAAMATGLQFPGQNVTLVTFGQPRVGDSVFAGYLNRYVPQTIRFVNNRDIVPHLPTELQGYQHAPREEWIRKGELYYCSPTNGEDPTCSDSLDFTTSIDDHLNYFGIEEDPSYAPPGSPYPGYCA